MTKNKELSCFDNILEVIDIRSTHSVLVVGNLSLPSFKHARKIRYAKELNRSVEKQVFDRIFIDRRDVDRGTLERLALMNCGLVVIFDDDKKSSLDLINEIESYWYPSNVWQFQTKLGNVVVSDFSGRPIENYYSIMSYQAEVEAERLKDWGVNVSN